MDMPLMPDLPLNPLDALGLGGDDGDTQDEEYELTAGPYVSGQLRVEDFVGDEQVNDTYAYPVTFTSRIAFGVLYRALSGQAACLTIKRPGREPKLIQGIVASFHALGAVPGQKGTARRLFRLCIVPRLWLLRLRRTLRRYHQKTPKEIIADVLKGIGISPKEVRWRIDETKYPKLPFVYQRDETDYDFFRRVLSDAGILFFFEHASGTLDSLLPGAGAIAGAVGSVADMIGGPAASAVEEVGAATKMLAVLTFIDDPRHTPAVQEMALANELVGAGLKSLASAIGGDAAAALIDESPAGTVPYDDEGASTDVERITEFVFGSELRPKKLRIIERDVHAAANWIGIAEKGPVSAGLDLGIGVGIGPGGPSLKARAAFNFEVDSPSLPVKLLRHELYQVNPTLRFYPDKEERMQLELERERVDHIQASGRSDCRALGAAYRFRLDGYAVDELNMEYTIVSFHCEGRTAIDPDSGERRAEYSNSFVCVPARVRILPPRWPRPRLSDEVAKVVSQKGERVTPMLDTDRVGGVMIRFPWEVDDSEEEHGHLEYGDEHDNASLVPVLQPWAGDGYGIQCLPREEMHVITSFLEGQGERPIVKGCLYDEKNGLPCPEDIDHHKIVIRTRTIPENGGYSGLSFGDHRDHELTALRAQRNYQADILNDSRTEVGANAVQLIGGNADIVVGGDHKSRVCGMEKHDVVGDREETVSGTWKTHVEGAARLTVIGEHSQEIQGRRETRIMGDESMTVERSRTTTLGAEDITTINRRRVVTVGDGEVPAEDTVHVFGDCRLSAERMTIEGSESVIIQCGTTQLHLTPKGLTLHAKTILGSAEELELSGEGPTLRLAKNAEIRGTSITLQSTGASLTLDGGAGLIGSKVTLGRGTGDDAVMQNSDGTPAKRVPLVCLDDDKKALSHCVYQLEVGGQTLHGKTDADGRIMVPVPDNATTARCRVWTAEYPEGPNVVCELQLEAFADCSAIDGAQHRLRNLGLYASEITGEVDAETYDAILEFQRKHSLKQTGQLDDATVAALAEAHP